MSDDHRDTFYGFKGRYWETKKRREIDARMAIEGKSIEFAIYDDPQCPPGKMYLLNTPCILMDGEEPFEGVNDREDT